MQLNWLKVTPVMAQELLKGNLNNRRVVQSRVKMYARDMLEGKWVDSPHGLIIGKDGKVLDGQHRLLAIIESGCTVNLAVCEKAPENVRLVVDQGKSRTMADILEWQHPGWTFKTRRAAVAMRMWMGLKIPYGGDRPPMSTQDKLDLIHQYRRALDFVCEAFPKAAKHLTAADVMAVIGRAYMQKNIDAERLAHFCEVLLTGIMARKEDAVPVQLRNHIIGVGTTRSSDQIYAKTAYALHAFLNYDSFDRLMPIKSEPFPIKPCYEPAPPSPEEQKKKAVTIAKKKWRGKAA